MGISPKNVRTQFWDARQFLWKWVDTVQMLHIVDMLQMLQMLQMIQMLDMVGMLHMLHMVKMQQKNMKVHENLRKSMKIDESMKI